MKGGDEMRSLTKIALSLSLVLSNGVAFAGCPVSAANSEGQDLGFNVDDFYEDTLSKFSELSDTYSDLAADYGNVPLANGEEVYMDYVSNLNRASEAIGYEEKLQAIKDTDLSINDAQLSAIYDEVRGDVITALEEKGYDISARTSDYEKWQEENHQSTRDLMNDISDGMQRYEDILEYYKEGKTKKTNSYSGKDLGEMVSTISDGSSKNPITVSTQFKQGFQGVSTLFDKINNGLSIEEMVEEYEVKNPEEFLNDTYKEYKNYVKEIADEGLDLDEDSLTEIEGMLDVFDTLETAIKKDDQDAMAESMRTIEQFMIDYDLPLPNTAEEE